MLTNKRNNDTYNINKVMQVDFSLQYDEPYLCGQCLKHVCLQLKPTVTSTPSMTLYNLLTSACVGMKQAHVSVTT